MSFNNQGTYIFCSKTIAQSQSLVSVVTADVLKTAKQEQDIQSIARNTANFEHVNIPLNIVKQTRTANIFLKTNIVTKSDVRH